MKKPRWTQLVITVLFVLILCAMVAAGPAPDPQVEEIPAVPEEKEGKNEDSVDKKEEAAEVKKEEPKDEPKKEEEGKKEEEKKEEEKKDDEPEKAEEKKEDDKEDSNADSKDDKSASEEKDEKTATAKDTDKDKDKDSDKDKGKDSDKDKESRNGLADKIAKAKEIQRLLSRKPVENWEPCKPRLRARKCHPNSKCQDISSFWEVIKFICVPSIGKRGELCGGKYSSGCEDGTECKREHWYGFTYKCLE